MIAGNPSATVTIETSLSSLLYGGGGSFDFIAGVRLRYRGFFLLAGQSFPFCR
jgi:hypothetical protein